MSPSVQSLFHWLSALIALPAIAYAGLPFFRSAAQALRARRVNMDVPISLGVTLATAMSLYQTHARQRAGLLRRGRHAAVLPAGRPLPRSAHAHARRRRRRQSAGPARQRSHRHRGRRHDDAPQRRARCAGHARSDRGRRALRRRRPPGRGPRRGRPEPDHRRDHAARGRARRPHLCRHRQPLGSDGDAKPRPPTTIRCSPRSRA